MILNVVRPLKNRKMGRLEKLKRQAILEANQRNLGIIVEQSKLDDKEKEVSEHNEELKKEIESMTKKLESLVMDKNVSTIQLKKTLKDLRNERKLMKHFKDLEKKIEKTEKDIESIEGKNVDKIDSRREGVGKLLKGLVKVFAGIVGARIFFHFSPDHKEHIKGIIDALVNKVRNI